MTANSSPSIPRGQLIFAGLFCFFLVGAEQGMLGLVVADMQQNRGISASQGGLFFALHAIGSAVAVGLSLVHAIDRRNPYRVALALASFAAGLALLAFAEVWSWLLLASVLLGLGFGGLTLGFNTLFATRFAHHSPRFLNLLNAVFGLGAVAAPALLANGLLSAGSLLAIGSVACGVLVLVTINLDDRIQSQHTATRSKASHTTLALLAAALFFALALESSVAAWLPTLLVRHGLTQAESADQIALYFFCFLLVRVGASLISHRIGARMLAVMGCGGSALLLGGFAFDTSWLWLVPLLGAVVGLIFPNLFGFAMATIVGGTRESAWLLLAAIAGATTGPWVMGMIAESSAVMGLLLGLTLWAAAALGCLVLTGRTVKTE
ncbi:transporter, major facilitator family [Luminiphilus syltensis NOR5-1B]|uniref:Transporter, major facilitator family n=1 Tax=Luminiphilus syltensis NOR5-1B TaxID=565045 RepID=B8KV24_9GAMM|nr:MFS transporter [Luminiphilus syltensis]EED35804.1 transporter, major facilitator family [Luminiphilus syltensis NOR5-1B]